MSQRKVNEVGAAGDLIRGADAIAAYVGVHPATIRRRMRSGALPGICKVGGAIMLSISAYRAGIETKIREAAKRAA